MAKEINPLMNNPRIATNVKRIATNRILLFVAISVIFVAMSGAKAANAASLYFSPSSGSYAVGATLTATVYVSSADQALNAASGIISFPSDNLAVISLSKTGSIFSLWVQEPSFSNSAGTVHFEGIVLNPGFTGSSGKAMTITFRAKAAGNGSLIFSSGSALANDGKGTNILSNFENAQFRISSGSVNREETAPVRAGNEALPSPVIVSSTHPDPDKWYAKNDASFSWPVPLGVTAARILVSKASSAVPSVVYAPPITAKDVADVSDGVWYFAVQLRNAQGWSGIARHRFQIDTAPPERFAIVSAEKHETDNPRPVIQFDTRDALSGMDHYQITIGDEAFITTAGATASNPYTLPALAPGKRTVLVRAYDRAGNTTTASEEFIITALAPPVITHYPERLKRGDPFVIKGRAYAGGKATVWLQYPREEARSRSVATDRDGNFLLIWDEKLEEGTYQMWADATDARGAESDATGKVTIVVASALFIRVIGLLINYLSLATLFVAILLLLLLVAGYSWYRLHILRKKVHREVREAEGALHKAFDLLREEIRAQILSLEKARSRRDLTAEEERIIQRLKKNIEAAERFVKKEIEDIGKEAN